MGRIDPGAKTLLLVALPGMMIAGSGHVHMIIASQFASLEPRAISWLYYADRLFQLPLGFVAAAVGVVLLPRVSKALNQDDRAMMAEAQSESFVFSSLLILPATVALIVLAKPITLVLFQRGAFGFVDVRATAAMLKVLAFALPAFVLIKVILPGFLAREEMRPPLLAVGIAIAANIATGLFFHQGGKWLAPAIGVAVGAWTNALVLLVIAIWKDRLNLLPSAVWRAAGAGLAAAVMGLFIGWMAVEMKGFMQVSRPFVMKGGALMAICLAGLLAYLAVARLLGVFTFSALRTSARGAAK